MIATEGTYVSATWGCRTLSPSYEPKKNSLSFLIGPPNTPPKSFWRSSGLARPFALANRSLATRLGEDGQLLISVSDTGVGLPAEKAGEIFNAFFTTKPQGSGMGLAISRSIVEAHGGRLWATANGGRGATFHFTLPQPKN
jgi:hypothetical protein